MHSEMSERPTITVGRAGTDLVGADNRALQAAVDYVAGLGGGTVEGYPEDAESVPAGFLFHGALSTYERLGFKRERKIGKHRWVVSTVVEPST
jgi:hypothetical protein